MVAIYEHFGLEFTIEEIKTIAEGIQNRISKDDARCIVLRASYQFVFDWYNETNTKFAPLVIKRGFRTLTETEQREISEFIGEVRYVPAADD